MLFLVKIETQKWSFGCFQKKKPELCNFIDSFSHWCVSTPFPGEFKTWKVKIIFGYRQTLLWATTKIEAFLRSFSKKTNLGRKTSRGSFQLVYKNILTTYLKNLAKKRWKTLSSPKSSSVLSECDGQWISTTKNEMNKQLGIWCLGRMSRVKKVIFGVRNFFSPAI